MSGKRQTSYDVLKETFALLPMELREGLVQKCPELIKLDKLIPYLEFKYVSLKEDGFTIDDRQFEFRVVSDNEYRRRDRYDDRRASIRITSLSDIPKLITEDDIVIRDLFEEEQRQRWEAEHEDVLAWRQEPRAWRERDGLGDVWEERHRNDRGWEERRRNDRGWEGRQRNDDGWEERVRYDLGWEELRRNDGGWERRQRNDDGWERRQRNDDGWAERQRNDDGWERRQRNDDGWAERQRNDDDFEERRHNDRGWEERRRNDRGWEERGLYDLGWEELHRNDGGWERRQRNNDGWEERRQNDRGWEERRRNDRGWEEVRRNYRKSYHLEMKVTKADEAFTKRFDDPSQFPILMRKLLASYFDKNGVIPVTHLAIEDSEGVFRLPPNLKMHVRELTLPRYPLNSTAVLNGFEKVFELPLDCINFQMTSINDTVLEHPVVRSAAHLNIFNAQPYFLQGEEPWPRDAELANAFAGLTNKLIEINEFHFSSANLITLAEKWIEARRGTASVMLVAIWRYDMVLDVLDALVESHGAVRGRLISPEFSNTFYRNCATVPMGENMELNVHGCTRPTDEVEYPLSSQPYFFRMEIMEKGSAVPTEQDD